MTISREIEKRAADPSKRADLLRELGSSNHPEAFELAKRFVDDKDYEVRVAALACFGMTADRASEPLVRRALRDQESLVRIAAVEALVELGSVDGQTLEDLQVLVLDKSESVRAYAGWALGRVGAVGALGALLARLPDESSDVAKAGMLEGLYRLTKQESYLHTLEELLGSSDPEVRAFVSNSMVGIASRNNVQKLILSLDAALVSETFPAIRDVLEDNLQTLREMDKEDDFET